MNINGIKWTSSSIYVDIDTGEIIKEKEIKNKKYRIIKTTKHATTNEIKSKGHIEYTRECKRNEQGKLFTD